MQLHLDTCANSIAKDLEFSFHTKPELKYLEHPVDWSPQSALRQLGTTRTQAPLRMWFFLRSPSPRVVA